MTDLQAPEVTTAPVSPTRRRRRRRWRLALYVVTLAAIVGATGYVWSDRGGPSDQTAASAPAADRPEPAPATTVAPTTTAPPSTTIAPPGAALRAPTPDQPLTVWFSGDSTAFTIANALRSQNTAGLLSIELREKISSGLSRPDFFDWNYFLGAVVDFNPPEVMVLSMGANDAQGVQAPDGTWHLDIHSPGWRDEYLRRVDELSRRITDKGTRLYWVGQPIAREPGYNAFVGVIDGIYQEVDARYDEVVYVDTYQQLADDTLSYTDFKPGPDGQPVKIRQDDGIHLERWGGELAAAEVLATMVRDWSG
jgi:hypothetical protein